MLFTCMHTNKGLLETDLCGTDEACGYNFGDGVHEILRFLDHTVNL